MEELKLCESEYRFMNVVWDNEPLTSRRLVELCAENLGWKKSTTYTELKKLCDRGFLKNEQTVVSSLVGRKSVRAYASTRFIENTFEGSLPGFLVSFLGGRKISASQAEELKKLIDEYRED